MSQPRRGLDQETASDTVVVMPRRATTSHHPFTRSLIATAASAVLPGSGLITANLMWQRVLGWVFALGTVIGLVGVVAWALTDLSAVASLAVRPTFLVMIAVVAAFSALIWVALITGTHLIRRPKTLTKTQRTLGSFAVGALSFLVSAPLAVGARYAYDQSQLVHTIFSSSSRSQTRPTLDTSKMKDVWANKPRLNLLLIGGDSDAKRAGQDKNRGILTDTIMVASIDTSRGDIVIAQVPRNMAKTPFPSGSGLAKAYPSGFYDGRDANNPNYFVNAIWNIAPEQHPELFKNTDFPGADALKLGIGAALGLPIDYFVMLNIDGLQRLIDSMGGVTVNINERLPMGGSSDNKKATFGWLEPGPNQHLDGQRAMWYARSRWSTDDYSRMARQSCLINAVVKQADPVTMLTRYEAIAKASSAMVETDIPQDVLPAFVSLALKAKDAKMTRVLFQHGHNGYLTTDPDFELMRRRVANVIQAQRSTPSPAPTEKASAKPRPQSTPQSGPAKRKPTKKATPKPAQDIKDACAYNPKP